jgi:peroxiredoxin
MALLVAALLAAFPPLELTDANGKGHRLSAYRGQVVLLNFWATWCEPCREELPSIERLRATLAGRPFVVLAVQMGGSARTARDTAEDLRLHFPLLLDRDSRATAAWGVQTLPTSFLIGPDGAVAFTHVGELDWSSEDARSRVEQLMGAAFAQEHMHHAAEEQREGVESDLQLSHAREGSGTSWTPDLTPVYAHHFMAGDWMLMLHYAATVGYDDQWSDRGSRRVASTSWVMGMGSHPLLGGQLTFRGMLSAEPATLGGEKALPLLLQSGESYDGAPLHDRQHPHDLFMETAAIYRRAIGDLVGVELYAAASGEPALGPTAFMHRPSAMNNPLPPIGHHWQDSTHISFGVLTAGVYNRFVKLEGSLFHGREPDQDRWNFDFGPLDSWSGRLSVNPTQQTNFQASYGYLKSPEALRPDESLHRVTASGTYAGPMLSNGNFSMTALWGRNVDPHVSTDSLLAEVNADLDGHNVPFLRLEYVWKLGHDLLLSGDEEAKYGVFAAQVGYVHRFAGIGSVVPTIGVAVNIGAVPDSVASAYGTNVPVGGVVFVGLQPSRMSMGHEHAVGGM